MLVLSRKIGERIRIGTGTGVNAIEVIVQRVAGDRVTLGIAASAHVNILRGELVLPDMPLANHSSSGSPDLCVSEPVAVV